MGGTGIASGEGSAYMSSNPAAAGVRPAASTRSWDWDVHLDWLNPQLSDDFDNSGDSSEKLGSAIYVTGGLLGQWRRWALGVSGSWLQHVVTLPDGTEAKPLAYIGHLILAGSFWDDVLTIGVGGKAAVFSLDVTQGSQKLHFDLTGGTIEAGAIWRPKALPLRVGLSMQGVISGINFEQSNCPDPMNCGGFILPKEVDVPWQVGAGIAWRYGATPWNQKIATRWRDERE